MNNEREAIEARLRELHSEMYYSEEFGDWQMCRAFEGLIDTLSNAKTLIGVIAAFTNLKQQLATVIAMRVATRAEIERLERELDNLPDETPELEQGDEEEE